MRIPLPPIPVDPNVSRDEFKRTLGDAVLEMMHKAREHNAAVDAARAGKPEPEPTPDK